MQPQNWPSRGPGRQSLLKVFPTNPCLNTKPAASVLRWSAFEGDGSSSRLAAKMCGPLLLQSVFFAFQQMVAQDLLIIGHGAAINIMGNRAMLRTDIEFCTGGLLWAVLESLYYI